MNSSALTKRDNSCSKSVANTGSEKYNNNKAAYITTNPTLFKAGTSNTNQREESKLIALNNLSTIINTTCSLKSLTTNMSNSQIYSQKD